MDREPERPRQVVLNQIDIVIYHQRTIRARADTFLCSISCIHSSGAIPKELELNLQVNFSVGGQVFGMKK